MAKIKNITKQIDIFIRCLLEGKSQRKSYRKAYPHSIKWKDNTVDVRACELFKDGKVQVRYKELEEKKNKKYLEEKNKADAKSILTRLELEQLLKRAALMSVGDEKTKVIKTTKKKIQQASEDGKLIEIIKEEIETEECEISDIKALPGIAEKIIKLNQWDKPKEETSKEDKIGAYFDKLREAMLNEE